jgi:choline dehydrogenase-like flavoprotein
VLNGPMLTAALRATTVRAARNAALYDAIVIGGGAAGGLAALLLTEKNLRVLVLDAGLTRSPTYLLSRSVIRGLARRLLSVSAFESFTRRRQPIQSQCHAWHFAPEAFVDDLDCPYVSAPGHPFVWLRARQLGGRWAIPGHGRQLYRFGPTDFAPSDGLSPAWPLKMGELDRWYAAVERRLKLAGRRDGLTWLPDNELSTVLDSTPAEVALERQILARWPGARPVLGRFAPPLNTLEAAAQTGRLLVRTGAIAREIEVDGRGHVRGVVWIDQQSGGEERAHAPIVFLCASALESTRLLLLSRPAQSPSGLGARSGVLGRYLMDHVRLKASGTGPLLPPGPAPEDGRCIYLPRFDSRNLSQPNPGRGFGVQIYQGAIRGRRSHFEAVSFAEMLPRPENQVRLDSARRDAWGIPVLHIECTHSAAELSRACDQALALQELAEVAGVRLSRIDQIPSPPGGANHECGTARMGLDPDNSVLNPNNECWDARGLYVTDAACFPSQGTQNPMLTIFALTARACDHAVCAS